MRDAENAASRHCVGADQTLVVGMQKHDAVQNHGGMAIVGELVKAERLRSASRYAL